MPQATIQLFCETNGIAPLELWLNELAVTAPPAYAKCLAAILELERQGNELRRPLCDALRDGIRELRVQHRRVNYRMLYFFRGKSIVVISHGCTKESRVPPAEIERAIARRKLIESDPQRHIAQWKRPDAT